MNSHAKGPFQPFRRVMISGFAKSVKETTLTATPRVSLARRTGFSAKSKTIEPNVRQRRNGVARSPNGDDGCTTSAVITSRLGRITSPRLDTSECPLWTKSLDSRAVTPPNEVIALEYCARGENCILNAMSTSVSTSNVLLTALSCTRTHRHISCTVCLYTLLPIEEKTSYISPDHIKRRLRLIFYTKAQNLRRDPDKRPWPVTA